MDVNVEVLADEIVLNVEHDEDSFSGWISLEQAEELRDSLSDAIESVEEIVEGRDAHYILYYFNRL